LAERIIKTFAAIERGEKALSMIPLLNRSELAQDK
jgi:hypothetical protein